MVSYYFPPSEAIGAVRVGGTVKLLREFGHEVRVLSVQRPKNESQTVDDFASLVVRTRSFGHTRGQRNAGSSLSSLTPGWKGEFVKRLKPFVHVPDEAVGWIPFALSQGEREVRNWKPDVIYASSSPPSSLLVAARLSRKSGVPWVGEYRDLWTGNHGYSAPQWRRSLDGAMEHRLNQSASALVTVSEPLAAQLRRENDKTVAVAMNGFEKVLDRSRYEESRVQHDRKGMVVRHVGTYYPSQYDTQALLKGFGTVAQSHPDVLFQFIGRGSEWVCQAAHDAHTQAAIVCEATLPRTAAVDLQQTSDVLLLILGQGEKNRGVVTAKIFDYAATGRPIVAYGRSDGVAVDLIKRHRLGDVASNAEELVVSLKRFATQYATKGSIDWARAIDLNALSRRHQTRIVERVLQEVVTRRGDMLL